METYSGGNFDAELLDRTGVAKVVHGTDAALHIEFFWEAVKFEAASNDSGYPIFKNIPHVRIPFPGGKNELVQCAVEKPFLKPGQKLIDEWGKENKWVLRKKFANRPAFVLKFKAFLAGEDKPTDGIPLEQWPLLDKSTIMTLKSMQIHTVEQLSLASDTVLQEIGMGARNLQTKAKEFFEAAKGKGAQVNNLEKENEELKRRLSILEAHFLEKEAIEPLKTE